MALFVFSHGDEVFYIDQFLHTECKLGCKLIIFIIIYYVLLFIWFAVKFNKQQYCTTSFHYCFLKENLVYYNLHPLIIYQNTPLFYSLL